MCCIMKMEGGLAVAVIQLKDFARQSMTSHLTQGRGQVQGRKTASQEYLPCTGESRSESNQSTSTYEYMENRDANGERPANASTSMMFFEHTTCFHQWEKNSPKPPTHVTRARSPGTLGTLQQTLTSNNVVDVWTKSLEKVITMHY